jgi:hypothetical protein
MATRPKVMVTMADGRPMLKQKKNAECPSRRWDELVGLYNFRRWTGKLDGAQLYQVIMSLGGPQTSGGACAIISEQLGFDRSIATLPQFGKPVQ